MGMKLWGIKISFISFAILIMAVGLCVDYNAHVAHAFYHTKKVLSVYERSEQAVSLIGLPVLKGGATTLAGTFFLAFSSSNVFRSIFKIMLVTVIFGCIYGLVALPVILPILCEIQLTVSSYLKNNLKKSKGEIDDKGKKAAGQD